MSVAARVPLDEISAAARQAHPGRTVLTVIAGLLFGLGWLAARSWLAVAWSAVAVKVGWQAGRAGSSGRLTHG